LKKVSVVNKDDQPRELTLRLILEQPTSGVDFALQKGRGNPYETMQKQRSDGHDLQFEFQVNVKTGRDGAPDFSGPLVQGAAGERFFYLDIGTYAGQVNTSWSRRLKVPLSGISWDLIKAGKVLIATVPGKDKDGGPSCAYLWRRTVSPSWGWQVEKSKKKR